MNKLAKTKFGIHFLLESRWSPRSFREDKVEKEKLQRIFEAAQWSPSSWNEQPWRFIIGEKGSDTYERILSSLADFNKRWAGSAPVLIVCLSKKIFSENHHENFHFLYDAGQSVAHLTFQAMHEGLYVHQMAGFHFEIIKNQFNIPEEFYIVTVIAVGYVGKPDILDDDLRENEMADRSRKEIPEIVFSGQFGNSWEPII
ncbi:MAG: nitroreductase family protein [Bacteroidota bacterium]